MRLIDAHALLTAYEGAMKELVQATNAENISLETLSLLCGAKLIAEAPTIGGWISVKDRLPDKGHDVLAFLDDGEETRIAACNYWDGVWFDAVMNTIAKNVVYWMPLPEPPEEVTGMSEKGGLCDN